MWIRKIESNFPLASLAQSNIPLFLFDFLGGSHGPAFNSGVSGKAQPAVQMTLKLFSTKRAGKWEFHIQFENGNSSGIPVCPLILSVTFPPRRSQTSNSPDWDPAKMVFPSHLKHLQVSLKLVHVKLLHDDWQPNISKLGQKRTGNRDMKEKETTF